MCKRLTNFIKEQIKSGNGKPTIDTKEVIDILYEFEISSDI